MVILWKVSTLLLDRVIKDWISMESTEKRKIVGEFNIDDYWAEDLESSLSRQFCWWMRAFNCYVFGMQY